MKKMRFEYDYHFVIEKEEIKSGDICFVETTATCVEIPSCHMSGFDLTLEELVAELTDVINMYLKISLLWEEDIPKPSDKSFLDYSNVNVIVIDAKVRLELFEHWDAA